jgi:hypothetical protein
MKVLNNRKIITATKADKRTAVDILCTAFKDDPQIIFIISRHKP